MWLAQARLRAGTSDPRCSHTQRCRRPSRVVQRIASNAPLLFSCPRCSGGSGSGPTWRSCHGSFLHANFLAVLERVRRIQYNPVACVEALKNLERGAVVAANRKLLEMRSMIGIHRHGAKSFRAKQQSIHGNDKPRSSHLYLQMRLCVTAGKQRAIVIWHIHLGQQGSRAWINGFGGTHDFALEFLPGILREFQVRAEPRVNRWSIGFRDAYINTDGIRLRQGKELLRSAAIARVDQ